MNLIYVDESGDDGFRPPYSNYTPGETPTKYFQMCGVIVHDRQWRKINQEINQYKMRCGMPLDLEFHASEILSGNERYYDPVTKKAKRRKNWYGRNITSRSKREDFLLNLCSFIATLNIHVIAVLIDKSLLVQDVDEQFKSVPKNTSWEYLIERVNLFLSQASDRKGMFIADAINYNIEKKHRDRATVIYKNSSHVEEYRFVESILFEPSNSSNLLQIADVVCFAIFKHHETRISKYYNKIKGKIFKKNGIQKGIGLKIWP